MKEIRYLGDFDEDVLNIKEPIGFRGRIKKFILQHFLFFKSLVMLGFLAVVLVDIQNILLGELILASIIQLVGITSLSLFVHVGFKQIRILSQSEHALLNLRKNLSKNFGISISKKNLKESSMIKSDEATSLFCNQDNQNLKEEKIIRYFELLDREEQIQVLKYVRSSLMDKNRELSRKYQLFLLEEEDYELENIPVTRKLKR